MSRSSPLRPYFSLSFYFLFSLSLSPFISLSLSHSSLHLGLLEQTDGLSLRVRLYICLYRKHLLPTKKREKDGGRGEGCGVWEGEALGSWLAWIS